MDNRYETAIKKFKEGYNCAQSVFCTYSKEFGIADETALRLASSFGGGMGRMRGVCGAVSAMFALLGAEYGYSMPDNDEVKEKHYALIQKAARKFKEKHGTIICAELLDLKDETDSYAPKPSKRTDEYYAIRPCENFIKTACEIISTIND